MEIQKLIYNFLLETRGFSRYIKSAQQLFAGYGIYLDSLQKIGLDIFTNRMAGHTSNPADILREFDLPNDERFTYKKWRYNELRGTKQCVFEMLNDIGHKNTVIYQYVPAGYLQRYISPYATETFRDRYFCENLFNRFDDEDYYPHLTKARLKGSFIVVIYECSMGTSADVLGKYGSLDNNEEALHHSTENNVYVGLSNQDVLKDICRMGAGFDGFCAELILCYDYTGHQSNIDTFGNALNDEDDYVEVCPVDVYLVQP
jgi:hypothetical protein